MENAAKALIIAGGILIAIMTLSLIVYASTYNTRIEQARIEKKEAEELAKFNKEYESYHKDRLYGVDVITVMNKAIEHNTKMQASTTDDPYYINIIFLTNEDFKNEIAMSVLNVDTKVKTYDYGVANNGIPDLGSFRDKNGDIVDVNHVVINRNEEYSLGRVVDDEFVFNNNVINIFRGYSTDFPPHIVEDFNNNTTTTYTLYSALTNFKRAIFTCSEDKRDDGRNFTPGVTYDPVTGRISEIRFMQLGTNINPEL